MLRSRKEIGLGIWHSRRLRGYGVLDRYPFLFICLLIQFEPFIFRGLQLGEFAQIEVLEAKISKSVVLEGIFRGHRRLVGDAAGAGVVHHERNENGKATFLFVFVFRIAKHGHGHEYNAQRLLAIHVIMMAVGATHVHEHFIAVLHFSKTL